MHRSLFIVAAVVAALAAPGVAAGQAAPNLTGEVFIEGASPPTIFNKTCNPDGTSVWNYTFSDGVAIGPFPGVVSETALVKVGPLTQTSPEVPFGFSAGTVIDFNVTFQVRDVVTGNPTVNGIKLMNVVVPENLGTCTDVATPAFPIPGFEDQLCRSLEYVQARADRLDYFAQIDTPQGTFFDEGDSALSMTALSALCQPLVGDETRVERGSLDETFVSTKIVTTPGQATGGGMVDFAPGAPGVTFAFTAFSDETGRLNGHCAVVSHQTDGVPTRETIVKCLDVTSYTQLLNHALFSGNAEVNGEPTAYRIDVTDNGPQGDTFTIQTDSGFTAGGVVTQGDVQVH